MKSRIFLVTGLYVGLFSSALIAQEKNAIKKENAGEVTATEALKLDANVRFVETFTIMGEGDSGQRYRKEIEAKRDLATEMIQEESKKIEKAKTEYVSKASTMADTAREKEEKKLIKMDRDLKNLVTEKEEELKLEMQIATENLVQEMEIAVIDLAKQENVDVVFDKMTGRAIYVSQDFDWTDKVIKRVNENHQVKVAQSKKQHDNVKIAENKKTTEKTIKS
jgi:Skp family chaperone for outer membrane proteins